MRVGAGQPSSLACLTVFPGRGSAAAAAEKVKVGRVRRVRGEEEGRYAPTTNDTTETDGGRTEADRGHAAMAHSPFVVEVSARAPPARDFMGIGRSGMRRKS